MKRKFPCLLAFRGEGEREEGKKAVFPGLLEAKGEETKEENLLKFTSCWQKGKRGGGGRISLGRSRFFPYRDKKEEERKEGEDQHDHASAVNGRWGGGKKEKKKGKR